MSEFKEMQPPSFESKLEKAKTLEDFFALLDGIFDSDTTYYSDDEAAADVQSVNREGIRALGRDVYFSAFEERYGGAGYYMIPSEEVRASV